MSNPAIKAAREPYDNEMFPTEMFLLKKLVSAVLLPPTSLVLLLFLGTLLLARSRYQRLGKAIALGSGVCMLLLSLPIVATPLVRALYAHAPLTPAEAQELPGRVQAIVVLAGGSYPLSPEYGGVDNVGADTLTRLRYGAWLHRQTRLPVLLTGGSPDGGAPEAETMARILRDDYGIEARWVEIESLDTHDNAVFTAKLLAKDKIDSIVLVTDARHMRRSMTEFENAGLKAIAAPTGRTGKRSGFRIASLFPDATALYASCAALKEWLGNLAANLRPRSG